jgi:hypothetical protein
MSQPPLLLSKKSPKSVFTLILGPSGFLINMRNLSSKSLIEREKVQLVRDHDRIKPLCWTPFKI